MHFELALKIPKTHLKYGRQRPVSQIYPRSSKSRQKYEGTARLKARGPIQGAGSIEGLPHPLIWPEELDRAPKGARSLLALDDFESKK